MSAQLGGYRVSPAVSRLSWLSAASLLLFGVLSVLISLMGGSLPGGLVGAALTVHGLVEWRLRKRFLLDEGARWGTWLAVNQLVLSLSVGAYLGWQVYSIDAGQLDLMLARDPLASLLGLVPPEVAAAFRRDLPGLIALTYALAGFVAAIGCLGMAGLYLREKRRLSAAC